MSLLPVLATAVMLACGEDHAESERLPRVDSAVSVPLSYFASVETSGMFAGLACTKLDPTGRSVRGNPVVIRVDPGGIYLGEELVVAMVDGVVPEEDAQSIGPLYNRLLDLAENHKTASDSLQCLEYFRGSVLVEIDKRLPLRTLTGVLYTAGQAQYWDAWIKVVATKQIEVQPGDSKSDIIEDQAHSELFPCRHYWRIHWAGGSIVAFSENGKVPQTVKLDGLLKFDALLREMEHPDWAYLDVAVTAEPKSAIEPLISLFADFHSKHGSRGSMALGVQSSWHKNVPERAVGQSVTAVQFVFGDLPGCGFDEVKIYCVGYDNAIHEWVDPCRPETYTLYDRETNLRAAASGKPTSESAESE